MGRDSRSTRVREYPGRAASGRSGRSSQPAPAVRAAQATTPTERPTDVELEVEHNGPPRAARPAVWPWRSKWPWIRARQFVHAQSFSSCASTRCGLVLYAREPHAVGVPPPYRGYTVIDDANASMWTEFRRFGGVEVLGYPVSRRYQYPAKTASCRRRSSAASCSGTRVGHAGDGQRLRAVHPGRSRRSARARWDSEAKDDRCERGLRH